MAKPQITVMLTAEFIAAATTDIATEIPPECISLVVNGQRVAPSELDLVDLSQMKEDGYDVLLVNQTISQANPLTVFPE